MEKKTKYYFLDRAAYMRGLAQEAETPQLRNSCLKAAAEYEALAEKAREGKIQDKARR